MEFSDILNSFTYLVAAFVIFLLGKLIFRIFNPSIKIYHELLEKDNFAFSLAIVGYYIGLVCAIGSAIVGPSKGILIDLIDIFSYGLLAIVLLNLAALINDKIILNKFNINKEIIEDRNAGTGAVEMANYVATGLIIYGSVVGEGGGYLTAIGTWFIAQIILVLASKVYNLMVPYNIHEEIEKDNVAVGIGYAGAMIAMANIIRFGIQSDFDGWADHLTTIGIDALLGLILLPVVRFLTDKILLPGRRLTDEIVNQEHPNIGAACIEAFAYIGGSVLITFTL